MTSISNSHTNGDLKILAEYSQVISDMADRTIRLIGPIDQALFAPGKVAMDYLFSESPISLSQNIGMRLAFLAQAIVSAVILPFKFLFCVFNGLYLLYCNSGLKRILVCVSTTALHAFSIPLGIIGTFLPSNTVKCCSVTSSLFNALKNDRFPAPGTVDAFLTSLEPTAQSLKPEIVDLLRESFPTLHPDKVIDDLGQISREDFEKMLLPGNSEES